MKKISISLLLSLLVSSTPVLAQNKDQVNLRLINAMSTLPPISLHVGGVPLFSGVAFNQVTPFRTVRQQEDAAITIQLADGRLLQATAELDDDDEQYTVLVTAEKATGLPKVIVLEGDKEKVDRDEVEITLINAAPGHNSIKLLLNDDTEARGVNYGEADDTDVKPGTYLLKIVDAWGMDHVIATGTAVFTGGTAVTILVTGPNSVHIVNDASPAQHMAGNRAGMTAGTATATMSGTATTPGASAGTGTPARPALRSSSPGTPGWEGTSNVVPSSTIESGIIKSY